MRPTRFDHALIDALEARTKNDEARARRPFAGPRLAEGLAARAHDQARPRVIRGKRCVEARGDDVRTHHHAGAAACGRIVDRPMATEAMLADVARLERP